MDRSVRPTSAILYLVRYLTHSHLARSQLPRLTPPQAATASAVAQEFSDALSSYEAEITKAPEWTSAAQILAAYQVTGEDVPAVVTASDDYVEYTTTPDWYAARSPHVFAVIWLTPL